ncbi:DUF2225 domain-containing protein [Aneurinibacillus sp. Ricciae_BoGa-3]|uniref:DUF2225 domain-containing protein n=1 Tax=Aneurinibacillus sp. Ricciae_BoGa-3 TaxID=3022697 RepID=UPI0023401AF6|nr:DUF2225 domain-containing protein [Aneurinibacillus sp. Ricciae_BoGa-3]WCK53749.1 DUF2225 domain-containing protein [Aneurinibacillus sp. Ricciae_BoGa-3]
MADLETILYDKKFKCAHCDHEFTSKKVRLRRGHPIQRDPDFCVHYANQSENPLLYHVIVCPECGFSFNDNFRTFIPDPTVEQRIQEKISDNWTKKDYTGMRTVPEAIAAYKLGIFTADVRGESHCVLAGLCMRLAWMYRFLKKKVKEDHFLEVARHEYELSLEKGDYANTDMTELKILYLVGELYRHLGNPQQAVHYFSSVIHHKLKDTDPQMVRAARDQWETMREDMKREKVAREDPAG